MRSGWTISRYLIGSVMPYFIASWLLLSVVLFVQQASRFSDIFFSVNIPSKLIWQLSFALIPNVIAFTCPMAALVGVIIGLTKMQADSELVAIRAAGVGNFAIAIPIVGLGIALSLFAFFVNLQGVPFAAGIVRQVALRTALHKLESPIEPGVFNAEVAGFTIYVREGDLEKGTWKNIFVFNEDEKSKTVRLITSSSGRIDYSNENSELVLENARSSTFSGEGANEKFFSERIGELRYAVKTRRSELVDRLNRTELTPDELGLGQLSEYAKTREGRDRIEAELLWQRRILLSVTPLIFCIFGVALVLRYNRGNRGFAVFSALLSLIVYYLLAFLGEQLARTGKLSVEAGGLVPVIGASAAILWLIFSGRIKTRWSWPANDRKDSIFRKLKRLRRTSSNNLLDLTTGLRDFDIIGNLVRYFLLSLGFLSAVFLIFTAFEMWRFAGTTENGVVLLLKYLFYLTPFIYLQLAPSAVMIAVLATFVVKSRQNEIITWTAAGQSVYRLLFPCLLAAGILGFVNWQVQERLAPAANQIQDDLRTLIRSRGAAPTRNTKLWSVSGRRIYAFEAKNTASDNANALGTCHNDCAVQNLRIYEFRADNEELQSVYRAPEAVWEAGSIVFPNGLERLDLTADRITKTFDEEGSLPEPQDPFDSVRGKPSHLDTREIEARIRSSESEAERRSLAVSLQRRYTTAFLPIAIALFTAPFALSLSRKGKAATVAYAVGLWLLFMGLSSIFEQLGLSGTLPAIVAVWTPVLLFSLLGILLLSKTRT